MQDKRFIAYYRVSTVRQGQSGLGLEAQKQAVEGFLSPTDSLLDEYVEIESGNKNDRPRLTEALAECRRNSAVLVIAKLDRLARNVAFVSNLMEAGVEFIAVDNPHATKLTIHILCAVAEHEREMISERTKAALQAAKARGVKLGNPHGNPNDLVQARLKRTEKANEHALSVMAIISDIQMAGLTTYRQVAKALNARGIATSRGGAWHATTVRNVMMRQTTLSMS